MMAKGVQKTLSKTSMLGNFLPTGTLLTFEMVLPSIYKNGQCTHMGMSITVFVTPKGLSVFKPGLPVAVPKEDKFKVGFQDLVHAIMSVMVFVAIAFSDHRVTSCLFPKHEREMDQVMESFPLMVGIVCSGLFLVFPASRRGIGCMSA
ncbi:Protein DMP [Sesbania bispinosa]|nr:Protein DMP [Sesbania bispinosa]